MGLNETDPILTGTPPLKLTADFVGLAAPDSFASAS